MKSISQINKRYLPHELKTKIHAVETYRKGTQYLKRLNNIPMQVLNYLIPIEMRQKLLNQ